MERQEIERRKAFFARVSEAMVAIEMNQAELARRVGASSATVSDWFSKLALPEGAKMLLLPRVLKVSGHWLLTGHGPRTPPEMDEAASVLVRGVGVALGRLEEWLGRERDYWRQSTATGADVADDVAATDRVARSSKRSPGRDAKGR